MRSPTPELGDNIVQNRQMSPPMSRIDIDNRHTPEDEAFIEECLHSYVAKLPVELCSGLAVPDLPPRGLFDFATLVPYEMRDGKPNSDGIVRWKRLTHPGNVTAATCLGFAGLVSSVWHAYLSTQHVCRMWFHDVDWSLQLPATPFHCRGCDEGRLVHSWAQVNRVAKLYPIAETSVGDVALFQDREGFDMGDESRILAFPSADLFRLLPRAFVDGSDIVRQIRSLLIRR